MNSKTISFDNTEIAFRSKTDADLKQAYWLFKVININFLTKIGPPITNFALKIGLPIQSLIKSTIFKHFCGGENIVDCEATVKQLFAEKVGSILDYSVEGEESEAVFDETCQEIMRTIQNASKDNRVPLTVFKPTGIGKFAILEKLDAKQALNEEEQAAFERFKDRMDQICKLAHDLDVRVMVDAEETWIQNTIDSSVLEMMRRYNQNKAIVYNTYQLYRHNKLASLKADAEIAVQEKFFIGAKLVRGAYMEKERKRAESINYPSPIQADKESTDRDYNRAIEFCIEHIDIISFVAGTHNEDSCRLLAQLLEKNGIAQDHEHVYFSQLLGMSDNLSFNLSAQGYNVAKYVPYGPVKAVMPYLFRRAEENTSVAGQMGRELRLISIELKRRNLN